MSERARTQEKETNGVDGKESANRVAIAQEKEEKNERKSDRGENK